MNSKSTGIRHLSFIILTFFFLTIILLLRTDAIEEQKRILVINSYSNGLTWTHEQTEGIISTIKNSFKNIPIAIEYMDWKNHPSNENIRFLDDYFEYKYRENKPDVIITTDDAALIFALRHRADLFKGIPIAFSGINEDSIKEIVRGNTNITGVIEETNADNIVSFALRVNPALKSIYVVYDNSESGKSTGLLTINSIKSLNQEIEIIPLNNKSYDDIIQTVSDADENSAVILTSFSSDSNGDVMEYESLARVLSSQDKIPVYSLYDFGISSGAVGGRVLSGRLQGENAGALALRILKGESASSIPISGQNTLVSMYNYEQMLRFDAPLELIEKDSIVINKPFSFYETYKGLVIGVFLAFIILLCLITMLLLYIRKHALAEGSLKDSNERLKQLNQELGASKEELRIQYEHIFSQKLQLEKSKNNLKNSEERHRLVFEAGMDGLLDYDMESNSYFISDRLCDIYGYKPIDKDRLIKERLSLIHPEDLEKYQKAHDNMKKGIVKNFTTELRVILGDGTEKYILVSVKSSFDESGRIKKYVESHSDITSRKQSEQELIRAKEEADCANRAKSDFLANMSHEIRNPMNGIIGMTELMLTTSLSDEQQQFMKLIGKSANSLIRIINDILDYSKIESGWISLENNPLNIRQLINEVVSLFNINAIQKGIELTAAVDSEIPQIILGDAVHIRQILSNLVGNAVKFTSSGFIDLSVALQNIAEGRIGLIFAVKDTGIGISKNQQSLLFRRFSQLDSSYTKKYQGAGLGLAISTKLVEMMGGKIWVESDEGFGSTFYFTVDLKLDCQNESIRYNENISDSILLRRPKKRILLAEDDEINSKYIKTLLSGEDYDVIAVENGKLAVDNCKKTKFDLLLMDIQMPVLDGVSAARAIRALDMKGERRTPIIAMTAYARSGDRERFLREGMDNYISKPVNTQELMTLISKYI